MRRIRATLATCLTLAALTAGAVGCSSDDEGEPAEIEGTADAADPAGEGGGDAEAELTELYGRYWDALIELENSTELDNTVFDGIATTGVVETEVGRVSAFKDNDIHRQGEPVIDHVTVTVDGDAARIESCKNEAGWVFIADGEEDPSLLPEELTRPSPFGVAAERTDDGWLISQVLHTDETTISC
ncbi:hypothetical protein [Streptomyces sp. PT12]|uniref:hypothetical protein n=1 Tax=Streptomyces sp. PT12 TaxID=1510197 RepID=UPI000DE29A06|nr:hypothetical protein [Streptomyces sp. PT12]RBM22114.1 hypothetical protein DEH69_04810 [Streptomyces sp. PT12]